MSNLTVKEETYAMLLFEGKSQLDAYREAYPHTKKWKDTSVASKASTLAKCDKIVTRVNELREKMSKRVEQKALMSASDVLNAIEDIYTRNKDVDDKTALKAVELYGKHLKLFTDRVESVNLNMNKDMTEEEADEILKKAGVKV